MATYFPKEIAAVSELQHRHADVGEYEPLVADFDPVATLACPVTVLRADPACGAVPARECCAFQRANPHAHITMVSRTTHSIHSETPAYLAELDLFMDSLQ